MNEMRIVQIEPSLPDRIVELMRKAYHLIPVESHLVICPNSAWDKMKTTAKMLVTDVTNQYDYRLQERSLILVKTNAKDAQITDRDKVTVKLDRGNDIVGKILMAGGECPFCSQNKLTFLTAKNEKLTVCLACKRSMVIINSDSIPDFQVLFPEIYKVV
jgi:hypothetical protein